MEDSVGIRGGADRESVLRRRSAGAVAVSSGTVRIPHRLADEMSPMVAKRTLRRWNGTLVRAALVLLVGCGGGISSPAPHVGMPAGTLAPAFLLPDVNPASISFATDVAPSQYVGSASAWYFGHAT